MPHRKHTFLPAVSILGLSLLSVPAISQSGTNETPPQQTSPPAIAKPEVRIVAHDKLVGAAVSNGLAGDKQVWLGSISDLVIDGATGQVRYGVVASGGTLGIGKRLTAVGWNSLSWDAEQSRFILGMQPDALEKMPAFDPAKVGALGAASTDARGEDEAARREATGSNDHRASKDAARPANPGLVLASKLARRPALAGGDEIGAINRLFLEPVSGAMAFVGVASGGVVGIGEINYVVPWAALRLVRPVGKERIEFQIGRTKSELQGAPTLGDAGADVGKADFRAKIYEFYGIDRPAFDRAREDQDGKRAGGAGRSDPPTPNP